MQRRRFGCAAGLLLLALGCAEPDAGRILVCSAGPQSCTEQAPQEILAECDDPQHPRCAQAREKIRAVRYMPDAATLVPGPFTREDFEVEVLDVRLARPWDLEFLPDGAMLVSERAGRVKLIRDGKAVDALHLHTAFLALTGVMGLAVDPEFETRPFVYVFYTRKVARVQPPGFAEKGRPWKKVENRISRWELAGDRLVGEEVLLDGIPGSSVHCGGRLEFGPDGRLYATVGDGHEPERARDPAYLGGKILRIEPDGAIPADNPIPHSPVYSLGHRNPQGLAWHPESATLFAGEHGERSFDEINRIRAGRDYGWGDWQCDRRRVPGGPRPRPATKPVVCFDGYTLAPSGMTFVDDPASPWHGNLFVAALRGKQLRRYRVEGDELLGSEIFFVNGARIVVAPAELDPRIRDVEYHDGSLYVIGDRQGLARITPRR